MPDIPGQSNFDAQCGGCGAHFQLDPAGDVSGAACSECGGTRFFMHQPSPTQSDGTLRNMVDSISQKDQGGNPLGEGTIVGDDGEKPRGFRDNYMHSHVAGTKRVEMRTSNTEPYPSLWEEEQINGANGDPAFNQNRDLLMSPAQRRTPPMIGRDPWTQAPSTPEQQQPEFKDTPRELSPYDQLMLAQDPSTRRGRPPLTAGVALEALPALAEGAGAAGAGGAGAGSLLTRALPFALPTLMRGVLGQGGGQGEQAGGMAPMVPDPAPSMEMMGSTDIPFMLMADYDTPHSIKSIDEQHDDPENQDQKEFNDGDKSPKNPGNPNNQDSGANGEDGVRDATPGFGIGPNSPSVERAMMILPLLMHYFNSPESGEGDPIIRGLHDSLEQENPGYLDNEHPDGQKYVEVVVQNHKSPHGVHAGVNAFPGGLPTTPIPGMGAQSLGGGTCPSCGGVLAGDGSCPQCGSKQHPQGGMQQPTGTGGSMPPMGAGNVSYPPNRVGNSQGPVNDDQKQVLHQAIDDPTLAPLFGDILNKIQNAPNSPPLVDPSQMTPPAPMPSMMNPPGAMPNMDPTQPGGGGMPMQPMASAQMVASYGWGQPDSPWHQFGYEQGVQNPDQAQKWHDWANQYAGSAHIPPGQPGSSYPAPMGQDAFHQQQMGGMPQPMARVAEQLPQTTQDWHQYHPDDYIEQGRSICPNCQRDTLSKLLGNCNDCGYRVGQDSSDVGLAPEQMDIRGPHSGDQMNMVPEYLDKMQPHWGATKEADANNLVPRCPQCGNATTSAMAGLDDEGEHKGRCHNCGATFPLKESRVALVDLPNPVLENASERADVRPEGGQDPSLTWMDAQGRPLQEGQTYSMETPGFTAPDEVKVMAKKPDQLDLKLVGQNANMLSDPNDNTHDFSISSHEMQSRGYQFQPSGEAGNTDSANEGNFGGMPGLEQIPQSPATTDETSNSYPNPGTVSSIVSMNGDIDDVAPYGDMCHKCGGDWIDHVAASPTTTMHECARCGTAWETKDDFEGRQSRVDLEWVREDSSEDFLSDRKLAMSERGSQSRNLSDIATKDHRLHAVRDVLSHNAMARTAGRHYTPGEQRALINERGTARNLEDLDLSNTHYEARVDMKSNPMNVPDSHLLLGV